MTGTGRVELRLPLEVTMKKGPVPINRDRIKQVIYPTLGYPAITKGGEHLTLEFDPRNQDWSKALPQITGFQVSVTTTNSDYPATRVLPVKDFTVGFSTHWPEYSQDVQPLARIYLGHGGGAGDRAAAPVRPDGHRNAE